MIRNILYVLSAVVLLSAVAVTADAQQKGLPIPLEERQGAQVRILDLAQADGVPVNLEIVSACVGDVATFKIVNVGERWPEMGTLKIFHVSNGQTKSISEREMRFAQGQKASFRLKSEGNGDIALFVDPSWYKRPFAFDAEVKCG
ncbi:MAG: hypothetical protein WD075_06655 [Rhodospirillales bacterium]